MTESEFWSLIDEARLRAGSTKAISTWLEERLAERSPREIHDFGAWLSHFMKRAHLAKLWNAGSVIAGGLGDDGFVYFKCWLISRGKAAYEAALLEPDSLADLEYPDHQPERGFLGRPGVNLESLLYVYAFAHNKKGGNPQYATVKVPAEWVPPAGCEPDGKLPKIGYEELLGSKDLAERRARFPRLMGRFEGRT